MSRGEQCRDHGSCRAVCCWSPSSTGGVRGLQGQWLQLNAFVSGTMAIYLAFGDSYRVDRCGAQNPLHRSRSNAVSAMSRKLGPCVQFLPSSEHQGLDWVDCNQTLLLDGRDHRDKQSTRLGRDSLMAMHACSPTNKGGWGRRISNWRPAWDPLQDNEWQPGRAALWPGERWSRPSVTRSVSMGTSKNGGDIAVIS